MRSIPILPGLLLCLAVTAGAELSVPLALVREAKAVRRQPSDSSLNKTEVATHARELREKLLKDFPIDAETPAEWNFAAQCIIHTSLIVEWPTPAAARAGLESCRQACSGSPGERSLVLGTAGSFLMRWGREGAEKSLEMVDAVEKKYPQLAAAGDATALKPDVVWPPPGTDNKLAPQRTLTLTIDAQPGKDASGVQYTVKDTERISAVCADPNVLWTKPKVALGTYKIVKTSENKCDANFHVKIIWTPVGSGRGGGSGASRDLEGSIKASAELQDSQAFLTYTLVPLGGTDVLAFIPDRPVGPETINARVEFADTAHRKLTVSLESIAAQLTYHEGEEADPWFVSWQGTPVACQEYDFAALSIVASTGRLNLQWNDGTTETRATYPFHFLRLNIARDGAAWLKSSSKPYLYYFKDDVNIVGYPSSFSAAVTVLPPDWEYYARPFSWQASAESKIIDSPSETTKTIKALAGSAKELE